MSKQTAIYLDYAAATPVDKTVLRAMEPYFVANFYNPSALYLKARKTKSDISEARSRIAQLLGARPSEVIFTSGGTESNNLAISGVMQAFPGSKMVISAIEHESVRVVASQYDTKEVSVEADGLIDLAKLEKNIGENTVLVSVMYANNEIGVVEPIREVSELLQKIRKNRLKTGNNLPLYLHTDACQAANYLDIHVSRLGVDMMTLNGGKIYGPKQSGILYVKSNVKLRAQTLGGGQERGLRSGTENVPGIMGFTKALEVATKKRATEQDRLKKLQDYFVEELQKVLPCTAINGSLKHRLPNNLNIMLPGKDNERLTMQLDEAGIMCATGSACSASKEESSHVLKAIGLTDDQARASLRLTMGRGTTKAAIVDTVRALSKIAA